MQRQATDAADRRYLARAALLDDDDDEQDEEVEDSDG